MHTFSVTGNLFFSNNFNILPTMAAAIAGRPKVAKRNNVYIASIFYVFNFEDLL